MKYPFVAALMIVGGLMSAVTIYLCTKSVFDSESLPLRVSVYVAIALIGLFPIALVIRFRKEE